MHQNTPCMLWTAKRYGQAAIRRAYFFHFFYRTERGAQPFASTKVYANVAKSLKDWEKENREGP